MSGFLPPPRTAPLRGGPVLRWGVLAPGGVAAVFARTVLANTDQRVVAAGSRSAERAQRFAERFGLERAHGSYAALLEDDGVDAVYIAAPQTEHLPIALLAIAAGKHVLVEKPLAASAAEGAAIAAAAEAAGVFAGEALWSAYLPQYDVLRQVLERGDLGPVHLAAVDVGRRTPEDPASRIFDPAVGGGVALDMGVYGYWFAQLAIGRAIDVHAVGTLAGTGVEDQIASSLRSASGAIATVSASLRVTTGGTAEVLGERGSARVDAPFVFPTGLRVQVDGTEHAWRDEHGLADHDGLAWQTTAVAAAIAAGRTDSPVHPIADAVAVLRTIDAVRAQVLPGGAPA